MIGLCGGIRLVLRREKHIFPDGIPWEEPVLLKDCGNPYPVKPDNFAFCWLFKPKQQPHNGGFADTALSGQRNYIALYDIKGKIIEYGS